MRQTLLTAIDLLHSRQRETVRDFAELLLGKLDEPLAPLEWLGQRLPSWRIQLDRHTEAALVWARLP